MGAAPAPGQLAWPLRGKVVAGYGFAYSEVHGDWRLHPGIDVAGEAGSPVSAAAPGVVRLVSRDPARGCTVEIDHGGGVVTAYLHLGEAVVPPGARVKRGQVIGHLGEPGQEEPGVVHVHFEVRVDGSPRDPMKWLPPR
jgi:murein DD-endopeptidase MepM/ murein hydrolase activator NlpD